MNVPKSSAKILNNSPFIFYKSFPYNLVNKNLFIAKQIFVGFVIKNI